MTWLLPLGFLGLVGIAVLILIYIIKPNYQNKVVSSTYVWVLSLKYKKKRVPISRLRSLLLLLCQILIITACALIMARPVIAAEKQEATSEKIAIIDASASMLVARGDSETRFERAVGQAREEAAKVLAANGTFTVILAGEEASFVVQRAGINQREEALAGIDALVADKKQLQCSYTDADIDGALELSEEILKDNPSCEVILYTGIEYYSRANDITVVNVAADGEWNAAILDVTTVLEDNYYTFVVQVASYGIPAMFTLHCDVSGVNGEDESFKMQTTVSCDGETVQEITFNTYNESGKQEGVDSFKYAYIYLENVDDWFSYDNYSYVYGNKDTVKVQYYSSAPNSFWYSILSAMRSEWTNWELDVTEVRSGGTPELSGYDFYIFEHEMPETLPTDGVVLLVDIDQAPLGSGLTLGAVTSGTFQLAAGEAHPIMEGVTAENISITQYTRVVSYEGYTPLMYCGGDPIFLVKNEADCKVAAFALNAINRSDFALLLEFPKLMINLFNYFLPTTMSETLFEVGEAITLNARGEALTISYPDGSGTTVLTELPGTVTLMAPGVYTVSQTLISGSTLVENFYVKISALQSDIFREEELASLYREQPVEEEDSNLAVYFAAALVALLFLEWLLQSRVYF